MSRCRSETGPADRLLWWAKQAQLGSPGTIAASRKPPNRHRPPCRTRASSWPVKPHSLLRSRFNIYAALFLPRWGGPGLSALAAKARPDGSSASAPAWNGGPLVFGAARPLA